MSLVKRGSSGNAAICLPTSAGDEKCSSNSIQRLGRKTVAFFLPVRTGRSGDSTAPSRWSSRRAPATRSAGGASMKSKRAGSATPSASSCSTTLDRLQR